MQSRLGCDVGVFFKKGCRIADEIPQGLKPLILPGLFGSTEVVPRYKTFF
jgi:hypothetical protein